MHSKEQWLEAYVKFGLSVNAACQAIGCTKSLYYKWREDKDFKRLMDQANDIFVDTAQQFALDQYNGVVNIGELKRELENDEDFKEMADDTPTTRRQKKEKKRAIIAKAMDQNMPMLDFTKFVLKMKGAEQGWKEKTEVTVNQQSISQILGGISVPKRVEIECTDVSDDGESDRGDDRIQLT